MEYFSLTEVTGYLASLIVLLSFLMKDVTKLRLVNTVGCLLFITYGILLKFSIPIILTNAAIVAINMVFLIKSSRKKS